MAFVLGCTLNVNTLQGKWQAVGFFQDGQSLSAPLDSVSLVLSPKDNQYTFHTLGHYREAGALKLVGKYLFLTDTTVQPAQARTLRVLYLSDDTLKLLMTAEGKEQVLFLTKQ